MYSKWRYLSHFFQKCRSWWSFSRAVAWGREWNHLWPFWNQRKWWWICKMPGKLQWRWRVVMLPCMSSMVPWRLWLFFMSNLSHHVLLIDDINRLYYLLILYYICGWNSLYLVWNSNSLYFVLKNFVIFFLVFQKRFHNNSELWLKFLLFHKSFLKILSFFQPFSLDFCVERKIKVFIKGIYFKSKNTFLIVSKQ